MSYADHQLVEVKDVETSMGWPAASWVCSCNKESQPMGKEHARRGHTQHARLARLKKKLEENNA